MKEIEEERKRINEENRSSSLAHDVGPSSMSDHPQASNYVREGYHSDHTRTLRREG